MRTHSAEIGRQTLFRNGKRFSSTFQICTCLHCISLCTRTLLFFFFIFYYTYPVVDTFSSQPPNNSRTFSSFPLPPPSDLDNTPASSSYRRLPGVNVCACFARIPNPKIIEKTKSCHRLHRCRRLRCRHHQICCGCLRSGLGRRHAGSLGGATPVRDDSRGKRR